MGEIWLMHFINVLNLAQLGEFWFDNGRDVVIFTVHQKS